MKIFVQSIFIKKIENPAQTKPHQAFCIMMTNDVVSILSANWLACSAVHNSAKQSLVQQAKARDLTPIYKSVMRSRTRFLLSSDANETGLSCSLHVFFLQPNMTGLHFLVCFVRVCLWVIHILLSRRSDNVNILYVSLSFNFKWSPICLQVISSRN